MNSRADKDIELWKQWKSSGNKSDLTNLFNQIDPVIQKEVSRWANGPVARPVLNIEAKKLSLKAFENFNPASSKLNTHVTNNLKGLSRIVYTYANPARLPEHQTLKLGNFISTKHELEEELGREATTGELAESLAWSNNEVARLQGELRVGYSTSQPTPQGFDKFNADRTMLDFIYNDLVDQDKLVFEHTTGYGGKDILAAKDLIKLTGMTQGQISHSKRRIKKMVDSTRGF
jgi:DNA-directed RNA polymerase specialized sigma subunit